PAKTNMILVKQAEGEFAGYLHLLKETARVAVTDPPTTVTAGQELALTGDTGAGRGAYHLHFAVSNVPASRHRELVTRPGAFSDYDVSDDNGKTWRRVERGVPTRGQWLRRTEKKRFR